MLISRRSALSMTIGALAGLPLSARPLGATSSARGLSLSQIVSRHTEARGGAEALDRVHSFLAMPTIVEKGSTLEARYLCNDAPGWRIDIYADSRHVFSEGLDNKGPWLWPSDEVTAHDAVPDAKRTGIQGIEFNLYGLHRFPSRGHPLHLDGREVVDGINYYVIRVTMHETYETFLYINPVSWMIDRRRDYRSFHPDMDQTKVFAEKQYSDFRWASGIRTNFAERQVNLKTGALVNSTSVKSLAYNPPICPDELTRSYVVPARLEKSI